MTLSLTPNQVRHYLMRSHQIMSHSIWRSTCTQRAGLMGRSMIKPAGRGSIQSQHRAPARHTRPPRPIPTCQWKYLLTQGVTTGASIPPPLPPVLITAAAVPPRRPPTSTAVDQNDPSQAPTAPSARLNQATDRKSTRL